MDGRGNLDITTVRCILIPNRTLGVAVMKSLFIPTATSSNDCHTGSWLALTLSLLLTLAPSTLIAQDKVESADSPQTKTETAQSKELLDIELSDKEVLKGQLYLPATGDIETLVLFIHGTGPGTYLNKRKAGSKIFNYFDFYGDEFTQRGVAFFSYNKRGVTMGDKAPNFDEVDREKFRQVVPHTEVDDIAVIVDQLKQHERLKTSKVALLAASEGTIIAAMVAEKYPDKLDAILLSGYAHENMFDIIAWQFSGNSSMLNLNPVFDTNGDNSISLAEYESDDPTATKYRKRVLKVKFKVLDANKDGILSAADFAIRTKTVHNILLHCTATGNEEWIWSNYFRISIPWLKEHFTLEPNKTRLTRLNLPIYVLHGDKDANVSVEGVRDLEKRFKALGKTNLTTFIFEDHNHNLNFMEWLRDDEMPKGFAKIFEVVDNLGADVSKAEDE